MSKKTFFSMNILLLPNSWKKDESRVIRSNLLLLTIYRSIRETLISSKSVINFHFLKFGPCYITGQWDEVTVKKPNFYLDILSWHFFLFVFIRKICFLSFLFDFIWSIEFLKQSINQSEVRISKKKELYLKMHFRVSYRLCGRWLWK